MNSVKIPSALKFLTGCRARLAGELEKTKRELARRQAKLDITIARDQKRLLALVEEKTNLDVLFEAVLSARVRDIAAVDEAIRLHPLEIDIRLIEPIRAHDAGSTLPRGVMTKGIYKYLSLANGKRRGVTETTVFIVEWNKMKLNADEFAVFRESVRHRMKNMALEGRILRSKSPSSNVESWYFLKLVNSINPRNFDDAPG